MLNYFAACPRGLEALLREELSALGAANVKETIAGVSFAGDMETGIRICLETRFATRVLLALGTFYAGDDINFYNGAYSLHYEEYFDNQTTIAVDFNGSNQFIRNTQYGAVRIKDAICDRFSRQTGFRPNVDRENPDVRINAHLDKKNNVTVSIDLSGESLHRRDYRTKAGAAPLKENLAQAIIVRSGYVTGNAVDPMCGSGTLLIEACMKAADMAPGLLRRRYGFAGLRNFDASLLARLKAEARERAAQGKKRLLEAGIRFWGFDSDPEVVKRAQDNIEKAGLNELIQVAVCDIRSLKNPLPEAEPGVLFCNPPYGERLGNFAELLELYTALGNKIRSEFPGWRAGIISSSPDLLSCLRLRAARTYRLFNGAIPCELRTFEIRREEPNGEDGEPHKLSEQTQDEKAGKTPGVAPGEVPRDSGEKAIIAADFANRLRKNLKRLGNWAQREGLEAYRIYDADLPDYAAAIDLYGSYVLVQEYQAPKTIPANVAHRRLLNMIAAVAEVLEVPGENIVLKVRERKKGDSQYEKLSETKRTLLIREYGCCFIVNLWDYLDTGLFLDHRLARRMVGEMSRNRDVLNVFAYTGSASVYAAVNGAHSVTTVDMSRTYLNWARENMKANGIKNPRNQFVQADCLKWIKTCGDRFDLIFADPPTFSNSRRMEESFDVQRDHADLLRDLKRLLKPGGVIVFSNNKRNFQLDTAAVAALGLTFEDVSLKTLPEDFSRNKKIHCCFVLRETVPGAPASAGKTGVPSGSTPSENKEEPA